MGDGEVEDFVSILLEWASRQTGISVSGESFDHALEAGVASERSEHGIAA
jgi:hypothetical protein